MPRRAGSVVCLVLAAGTLLGQQQYDLLLTRGHVIDPKNGINAVKDVAISNGKIAAVADRIDPSKAFKTVDVSGLYVAPGFIDITLIFGERRARLFILTATRCGPGSRRRWMLAGRGGGLFPSFGRRQLSPRWCEFLRG
jgi:hypothetical protein